MPTPAPPPPIPPSRFPALPLRIPPQNLEAEQMVLGSALISRTAADILLDSLDAADFYLESHRSIFRAIHSLVGRDAALDMFTVADVLRQSGLLEKAGGASYINNLAAGVATASHAAYYAKLVRDAAAHRELIEIGGNMTASAFDKVPIPDILDAAQQRLFSLECSAFGPPHLATAGDLAIDFNNRLAAAQESGSYSPGVSTGYQSIDQHIYGLRPGYFYVIAGRPGAGKTAACGNFARNALRQLVPVGVFSMEMQKHQFWNRLLAMEAEVNSGLLERLAIPENLLDAVLSANQRAAEWPLYVEDQSDLTIRSLRARARQMVRRQKVETIYVDYLQLVVPERGQKADVQHYTGVAQGLQAMAKELGCAVVALSQLSRSLENRESRRPRLSDLRESGGIEQAADAVLALYSENYYLKQSGLPLKWPWVTEFSILKHRHGDSGGIVKLEFVPKYTLFREPADALPDPQEALPYA